MSWLSKMFKNDPPPQPQGPSAEEIAAEQRRQQIAAATKKIVESARMQGMTAGAGGLRYGAALGDAGFGSNLIEQDPVALYGMGGRTRLGI